MGVGMHPGIRGTPEEEAKWKRQRQQEKILAEKNLQREIEKFSRYQKTWMYKVEKWLEARYYRVKGVLGSLRKVMDSWGGAVIGAAIWIFFLVITLFTNPVFVLLAACLIYFLYLVIPQKSDSSKEDKYWEPPEV